MLEIVLGNDDQTSPFAGRSSFLSKLLDRVLFRQTTIAFVKNKSCELWNRICVFVKHVKPYKNPTSWIAGQCGMIAVPKSL